MDEQTQTPKQKIKQAFRTMTGHELANKLREYWKLKSLTKKEEKPNNNNDFVNVFAAGFEVPEAPINLVDTSGILTPPRTT